MSAEIDSSQSLPKEQEHQRKLNSDPTRAYLRQCGFTGDTNISYSMTVISTNTSDNLGSPSRVTFDNYEDTLRFIRDNPDALTEKQKNDMEDGIPPFRIDYDQSVYDYSKRLPDQKREQNVEIFNKFAEQFLDPRKWKANEKSEEITQYTETTRAEILSFLDAPELSEYISKNVADPKDLERVINEMDNTATDATNKTLADLAQKDLGQLHQLLSSSNPEDLRIIDQVVAKYIYRDLSQQLREILNDPGSPTSWEDKSRLVDSYKSLNMIMKREQDGLKTRDLILVQERINGLISSATEAATPTEKSKVDLDPKADFGFALNRLVENFRDGSLPQLFREFIKSSPPPTDEQYRAVTVDLKNLYKEYSSDKRLPSDKIREFTNSVREIARKLNSERETVSV